MTKIIALTQGKVALVDDEDFEWLNHWKWHAVNFRGAYYAARAPRKNEAATPTNIYMHRLIAGIDTGLETHHLNSDGLDNRRSNIRVCTAEGHRAYHYPELTGEGRYRLTVYLKEKQHDKLKRLALLSGRTKQSVVRVLIENAKPSDLIPEAIKAAMPEWAAS